MNEITDLIRAVQAGSLRMANEDQPRDPDGKFASGSGGSDKKAETAKRWKAKRVETKQKLREVENKLADEMGKDKWDNEKISALEDQQQSLLDDLRNVNLNLRNLK